jgi:arginine-tRNA-protein transferase
VDDRRVELYNLHKAVRALDDNQSLIDQEGYRDFLVSTCCYSFELRYKQEGRLIGIAVSDRGARSISAVYCCFDPSNESYSNGTYSILKQVEFCRSWGLRYLYLGLFIADCKRMLYKARFLPHERLLDGKWTRFC